ncbi:discoidin domain-containing protein [Maribacter sp. 2304DJ31-5]|uniref:discoidin domain-containing protein n=1 Tax=Maribacter sp. 2304DJ31-5 TaxID=3386273 RepID=UPI0039BC9FC3
MKLKKKSGIIHVLGVLSLLLGFGSCDNVPKDVQMTLDLAGENSSELKKVFDHYQNPKDSLKLKAAHFLIGNMANKYFRPYNSAQKEYLAFLDSLLEKSKHLSHPELNTETVLGSIDARWSKIRQEYSTYAEAPVFDVNVVTSKMLIDNIDRSFKTWERSPLADQFTFEEFCEYVLPYRNVHDVPGNPWREEMSQAFGWAVDSLERKGLSDTAKMVNDSLYIYFHDSFFNFDEMPLKDMFRIRYGTCRQHSSKKIAAFRSLGIPIVQLKGLHGTSWAAVPDTDKGFLEWESGHVLDKGEYVDDFRKERYSKIFMATYKIQPDPFEGVNRYDIPPLFQRRDQKDVTQIHTDAMDVEVELTMPPRRKTDFAYLYVFNDETKRWEAAHWGKIKGGKVVFDQMGLERIYLPTYYSRGTYYPAGNPFYLDKDRKVIVLKSDVNAKKKERIYRKIGLNLMEHVFSDLMVHTVFEGSNDRSFTNATELFTIKAKPSHADEGQVETQKEFRFVRYRAENNKNFRMEFYDNSMYVAEVAFYNGNGEKLKGSPIGSSPESMGDIGNAFDGDIRTNFNHEGSCWIGLDLGSPQRISKIKHLFRNSFNTIEPGDEYELLYWENEWKSLGRQKARSDYLEYTVPGNPVLWLRNLTKGKEEMIFFMKDGKQIWG